MLKRWAVSQLSSALADYLEGVTPESVHGSLGTDTGELDLQARLNPAVLRPYGFELVSSDVRLHVRIPWRHLQSQPTEFTVNELRLEVRPLPPRAGGSPVDPEVQRARKEAETEKLLQAAEARGIVAPAPGRVASASAAILRQLQVSMECVEVRVDRGEWSEEPLELVLESARLASVGSDWASPPDPAVEDLHKVLGFSGLCLRSVGSEAPILGPLVLELRLLHAPVEQRLWLRAMTSGTAAMRVDPGTVGSMWRLVGCMAADDEGQVPSTVLSEGAGHEYARLYLMKIKGEAHDRVRLQEIEDAASAAWLAAWRGHTKTVLAAPKTPEADPTKQAPKRRTWGQWIRGTGKEEREEEAAKSSSENLSALLAEAADAGLMPEVPLPARMEMEVSVPKVQALCFGQDAPMDVTLKGAECSLQVCARVPTACQTVTHLWDMSARLDLKALDARFDDKPLLQLLENRKEDSEAQTPNETQSRLERLNTEWFDPGSFFGSAVRVEVDASQRDVQLPGKPPLDMSVSLNEEPIRVFLEAKRIHTMLASMIAVMKELEAVSESHTPHRANSAPAPSFPDLDKEREENLAMTAVFDQEQATLKLAINFEAPIVQWEFPNEGAMLLAYLGGFHVRTCHAAIRESKQMPVAEAVSLNSPAFFCQLKDTSVAVVTSGVENWVYEPSTVILHGRLDPSEGVVLYAEASAVRCWFDSEFVRAIGQVKAGLDYAFAPLAMLAGPAGADAEATPTGGPRTAAPPADGEKKPGNGLQLELAVRLCEFSWGPRGGSSAVVARFGGTEAHVEQRGVELSVKASLASMALESGGTPVVSCEGAMGLACHSSAQELRVDVRTPPVTARWAAKPVMVAIDAMRDTGDRFVEGTDLAREALPLASEEVVSQLVMRRAEQLGEGARAYVQAELTQVGLAAAGEEGDLSAGSFVRRLSLTCSSVALTLEPRAEASAREVRAMAVDLQGEVELLPGEAKATLSLSGMDLDVGSRRILTPRSADVRLLEARFQTARGSVPSAGLSWAQVVLVYRQQDINALTEMLQGEVLGVFSGEGSSGSASTQPEPKTKEAAATADAAASSVGLEYTLSIAAPLVFAPMDAGRLPVEPPRSAGAESSVEEPPEDESQPRGSQFHPPSRLARGQPQGPGEPLACLLVLEGVPHFRPVPNEDFLIIDFGHLEVRQGSRAGTLDLHLREMQMLSAGAEGPPWKVQLPLEGCRVLHPLGVDVHLALGDGLVDIRVLSPTEGQDAALQLSLTRAQMTLLLDVLWFNVNCHQVGEEPDLLQPPVQRSVSAGSVVAEVATSSSDLHVMLGWQGPLRLDISFTSQAPLASLELVSGNIDFQSTSEHTVTEIRCQNVMATDTRVQTRNLGKKLLHCLQKDAAVPSLKLVSRMPRNAGETSRLEVCLEQPVLYILPQLFMDIATWGLSGYQQSAQAKAASAPPPNATRDVSGGEDVAMQVVDISVNNAALRVGVRWDLPEECFEFVSGVSISILQTGSATVIKQIRLNGTTLHRVTPLGSMGQLCFGFGITASGRFESSEDCLQGQRLSKLECNVSLDTLRIRLSVSDCNTLMGATMELLRYDAEPAEPAEELHRRDPLALSMQQRFSFTGSLELHKLMLHILDDLDKQGAARLALELELDCPLMLVETQTAYGEPAEMTLATENLELSVQSYNERVSHWEPVLAKSAWHLRYSTRKKSSTEALTSLEMTPPSCVNIIATVPFVQLASRLLPALGGSSEEAGLAGRTRYNDILLGLNLSSLDIQVGRVSEASEVNHDIEDVELPPANAPHPLGALLRGWDGTPPPPRLVVRLPNMQRQPCREISLAAESTVSWNTPAGLVLLQVLMPRPPQRVIVISSSVTTTNLTPFDVEVRFLKSAAGPPLAAEAARPCAPAAYLDWELEREAEVRAEREGPGRSRAPEASPASWEPPPESRPLRGYLRLESLAASELGSAEYRVGSLVKGLFVHGPNAYVVARLSDAGAPRRTRAVRASGGRCSFREPLRLSLPEGSTLGSLRGARVELRVMDSVGVQASLRGDPIIGAASLQLSRLDHSGAWVDVRLQLKRKRQAKGWLTLRVSLQAEERAASASPLPSMSSYSSIALWPSGASSCAASDAEGLEVGSTGGSDSAENDVVGVIRMESGGIVSAPLAAVSGGAPVWLQVRPACTDGCSYCWGPPLCLDDLSEGKVSCSRPAAADLGSASKYLHLSRQLSSTSGRDSWHDIRVEPPFRIANACPCDVHCAFGTASQQLDHVEHRVSECDSSAVLRVLDGYGGYWQVPPDSNALVSPVRLDQDGFFHWCTDPSELKRVKPGCRGINALRVERHVGRVLWHCFRLESLSDVESFSVRARIGTPFSIKAQQEYPIFELPAQDLVLAIALSEQFSGKLTTWSAPVPIVAPSTAARHVPLELDWWGTPVVLGLTRQPGRRVVVAARNWFVDATGLGTGILQGAEGPRLPVFGTCIALPGLLAGESPEVHLSLPGQPAVPVPVPALGGSVSAWLSSAHRCVLKVEPIAAAPTFGVLCKLLSVVPGLIVFNQLEDTEVGFRQQGFQDPIWLPPGGSSAFYASCSNGPVMVEVAVRALGQSSPAPVFSAPFEISERGIGAFPRSLRQSDTIQKLVCVQIDEGSELVTINAAGASQCHQLVNKHPCLWLEACFEGEEDDPAARFVVPFGERAAVACNGSPGHKPTDRLVLVLWDSKSSTRAKWKIDLKRTAVLRSKRSPAAKVAVAINGRVAEVTVTPMENMLAEFTQAFEVNLAVPRLCLTLIGERPRSVAFAVTLEQLAARWQQSAACQRKLTLDLRRLQVDLHASRPSVVLASVKGPLLHMETVRDDVSAQDVLIRSARLQLGALEVTVFDALMREAKHFAEDAVPKQLGLSLGAVLARAGIPYNLSCSGPLAPSQKYVLQDVSVSKIEIFAFCRLHPNILPDILTAMVTILSGFASAIEVDGARVKLAEQHFFRSGGGFEGSLGSLTSPVLQRYKKIYVKALLSLLNNSNLFLGGVLTRQFWVPKHRSVQDLSPLAVELESGVVRLCV